MPNTIGVTIGKAIKIIPRPTAAQEAEAKLTSKPQRYVKNIINRNQEKSNPPPSHPLATSFVNVKKVYSPRSVGYDSTMLSEMCETI